MKCIYSGFDKLDITFQGALLPDAIADLQAAKEKAQETERPVPIELGPGRVPVVVHSSAAPHYSYRVDTGPDGEVWFLAKSPDPSKWGIRVSLSSMGLAIFGYAEAKRIAMERLEGFGAQIRDHRVSRADYAMDFLEPLEIDLSRFAVHHSTNLTAPASQAGKGEKAGREVVVSYTRDRPQSVTIGKMPGRQVALYNKRREVMARRFAKKYWWDVWSLDPKNPSNIVWRLEVRAGSECLRRFNILRLADLEAGAGNLFKHALLKVQYKAPGQTDSNRSRHALDPLWIAANQRLSDIFAHTADPERPARVIAAYKADLIAQIESQFAGTAKTYAVLLGMAAEDARRLALRIGRLVESDARANPARFAEQVEERRGRYVFLDAKRGGSKAA